MRRFAQRSALAFAASARFTSTNSKASELAGPTTHPILDQLAGYYVNVQSRKMYYKDFLRIEHQAVRWAFADIRKNSEALAHGLLQSGVRPGDKILLVQPTNSETLVTQLACAKIGAMACIMPHYEMTADKLRYYLNEFQPRVLIVREWLAVPEKKGGQVAERNTHFWDTVYNVLPELAMSYPGQHLQWVHSQEFHFLKKIVITDHNVNLLSVTPMRKMLVWGPFSYYEQRLRKLSALLHPEDPILALEDSNAASEDKKHIAFSHKNCNNAGFMFSQLLGLKAESRFGVFPNHHIDPVGAIIAPYAALTSGAVLTYVHDNLFNDEHVVNAIEKICVEELCGILGKKTDFDLMLKHAANFDADQYEHLKWVALFEDAGEPVTSNDFLQRLADELGLEDVYVFRGPLESAHMLSWRSLKKGDQGLCPHTEMKVVGDRGTSDAKILGRNARGNLRIKGPQITSYFVNNAGFSTELVDEKGYVGTSREALIEESGAWKLQETQTY